MQKIEIPVWVGILPTVTIEKETFIEEKKKGNFDVKQWLLFQVILGSSAKRFIPDFLQRIVRILNIILHAIPYQVKS